jgi:hypothetical protein
MFDNVCVIDVYTRAEAIEDGALIDVTETAREAGFRRPVALTQGAWADCVHVPPGLKGQDEQGRLWDVLWMLLLAAIKHAHLQTNVVMYFVMVQGFDKHHRVRLKAVFGPDDDGKPCITIMLPHED